MTESQPGHLSEKDLAKIIRRENRRIPKIRGGMVDTGINEMGGHIKEWWPLGHGIDMVINFVASKLTGGK